MPLYHCSVVVDYLLHVAQRATKALAAHAPGAANYNLPDTNGPEDRREAPDDEPQGAFATFAPGIT